MGSIIVSCAVIYYVKNINKFLICHPTGEIDWSLPKGKIDEADGGDEALCAVRELKEETGIDISKDKLIRLGRFDYYRKERGNKVDKDLVVFLYPAICEFPTQRMLCDSTFISKKSPDTMIGGFSIKNKAKFISDEVGYSYAECDNFSYTDYKGIDAHFHEDGKRVLNLAFSSEAFKSAMPRLDEELRITEFNDEERAFFAAALDGNIYGLKRHVERGNDVDIYEENGLTALLGAVLKGHVECVKYLIKAGADVNFYTCKNFTPLLFSIPQNNTDIVMMLLNAGADPTATTSDPGNIGGHDTTPFHLASEYGYLEELKIIIDSGIDVDCRDINGNTALHRAAKARIPAALKILLEAGADPNVINNYGRTPIINASTEDSRWVVSSFNCDTKTSFKDEESYACISLLLAAGADVNIQDNFGCTAFQSVSEACSTLCIKLLLANGADPNVQDKQGMTALQKVAAKGSIECIKLLLESGADINPLGNEGSVLHGATSFPEIVKFLINNGAGVNYRTKDGSTPLHNAARNSFKSLKILLEKGADPNAINNYGYTAMHYAAAYDRPGSIKLLAHYGADTSFHSISKDRDIMARIGSTAMHIAARNKHPKCIDALAGIGADINPRDMKGRIPLHYAALKNRPECVKTLCDLGADINAVENIIEECDRKGHDDERGRTALHCAVDAGSYRCCEILLNAGADASIKNISGSTATEQAKRFGKRKIIKIFKAAGLYD